MKKSYADLSSNCTTIPIPNACLFKVLTFEYESTLMQSSSLCLYVSNYRDALPNSFLPKYYDDDDHNFNINRSSMVIIKNCIRSIRLIHKNIYKLIDVLLEKINMLSNKELVENYGLT
jgi:hypothetical protein